MRKLLINSRNQNIFPIFKRILFAVKFPFQRYIVCWSKVCHSKIIGLCVCVWGGGGGGGRGGSHLRLLFCKIVYTLINTLRNFAKSSFVNIFAKFEYFAKIIIYSKTPDHVLLK